MAWPIFTKFGMCNVLPWRFFFLHINDWIIYSNIQIILINIHFHLIRYAKISYEESTLSTPDQIWYDC